MFLRSLTIRGFKSFAEKTVLEFAPGVSVIVGPNGSGKSNLVDAISWVLGEQGPRALRGGQMADVIFAGSPARPALGMAEVKLVIDNSAGLIPVPLSEIEVSRMIFRSGESEYRVGGQLCRLMDVQELLSESGIGRALHTVVGQGQLEDVLSARSEDRRQYIEEAAGIAKHRRRKERAERKLASLDQDLLRLSDVLAELKRQLRPLRQQAEMARRHEELTGQAEEMAWRLAAARLSSLLSDRQRRQAGWEEGIERRRAARERLESLDEEVGRAADERARAAWALQEVDGELQRALEERSAAELELRGAVERASQAKSELAEHATSAMRHTSIDEELGRVESEIEEATAARSVRERELEEAELAFRLKAEERRLAEEERRRLSEQAASQRAEVETVRRSMASHEREGSRVEEQLAELDDRMHAAKAERASLEEEIERLDAGASPLAERRSLLERERHGLADKVAELEEVLRRHEARKEVLAARLKDHEETSGSRFLESHRGRAIGLLGDLVRAAPRFAGALAAGLGPFADAVVYGTEDEALADAASGEGAVLAVAGGGPVSFVLPGERTLLSVVQADPVARGLVCTLLRDVYLAADAAEAADKHRRHPKAAFVTPDGLLIGPAVIRTPAETDARGREIRAELTVVEHDLAQAKAALRPRGSRLHEIATEASDLLAEIERADAEITAAAEGMAKLDANLAALRREEELLRHRLAALDDSMSAWRDALAAAGPVRHEPPALPPTPDPPVSARVSVETLRRGIAALEARRARLRDDRTALEGRDPAALKAASDAADAARAAAEERLRAASDAAEARTTRRTAAAAAFAGTTECEADVNRAWRESSTELDRLREEYQGEDRVRGDLERRIGDAERLLREGHGRDPREALLALSEEDTAPALERKAELVQRRLGLLGRVNLLAAGEFETVQERHDFLARELDDVRKARRDLLEVIRRVDDEIAATFDAAYRDVAAEFERLFGELFPGGEGRLSLTDPAHPLETGIEIEARPGRKRVKRISLLSGGERALAALAFLFAIFRARPSPFYLMDEVEPALDDVNLHRFLKLIRSFAADSQVIVVTHQKRTMEVAGMLYGVSMGKDGTSKVVCQRLDHPENGQRSDPAVEVVSVVPEPDAVR